MVRNKSEELLGSIKNQKSSKEENRMQPFRNGPLLKTRENMGIGMLTAAG